MNFKPTLDKILVKPREPITQIGLISVPVTNNEKHIYGNVVAVGPGNYNENAIIIPMSVSVGNEIFFAKATATEIKIDGQDFLILKDSDVIAIIE